MKRWLLYILAALSLVLFVATVAMWVRSYYVADCWNLGRGNPHGSWCRIYSIDSGAGLVDLHINESIPAGGTWGSGFRWSSGFVEPSWLTGENQPFMGGTPARRWAFLGFAFLEYRGYPVWSSIRPMGAAATLPKPILGWRLVAPYWALALASAAAAAGWGWAIRKSARHARRNREGRCLNCDYDLRASNDRCPECGTPIPSQSKATP